MDPDPRQGDADPQEEERIKNVLIPIQHTVHTNIKLCLDMYFFGIRNSFKCWHVEKKFKVHDEYCRYYN